VRKTQYAAVISCNETVASEKDIYHNRHADAKPTPVSSTRYDEFGSHFALMNQYEKESESKVKHKSLM